MCGIAGFTSKNAADKKDLDKMLKRIEHRGPDGSGTYLNDNVALGHRRLSIIDIEGGMQPMYNEDKSIVVVFNGEIYNFQDLRRDLKRKGHIFHSKSDTEVIIHGYEEYGADVVKRLRGMFAFVLYDSNKKELFGARDPFGIKPFYYYKSDDTFMFASEIKAFLDHSLFKKELNTDVLDAYLRFNYTPSIETFFKNVYKLDAGEYFIYKDGNLDIERYYEVSFEAKKKSFDEVVNDISEVMKESVSRHMISDVEVGSFLSSGIDSSYLVALARPDKTYTVGYDNPKYDETSYARDLASKLGINNTSKQITKKEYFDNLSNIIYHMDEPLADPAAIALYFVAGLASKDLKVVLSGEGADEFFGGYNTYHEELEYPAYNKIPYFLRRIVGKIAIQMPQVRGINFLVRRGNPLEDYYIGVNSVFGEKQSRKVLNIKCNYKTNKELTKPIFDKHKKDTNIEKRQAIDIYFWLQKDILQKADKMTMAHSIEGRVPFCDKEVFRLARTIEDSYKITPKTTKYALRMAAKRDIPNESYNKKKLGFPVPVREWIKEEDVRKDIEKSFTSDIALELFKTKKILKLLDDHIKGRKDNYKKIWTIYTFLVWYNRFFKEEN